MKGPGQHSNCWFAFRAALWAVVLAHRHENCAVQESAHCHLSFELDIDIVIWIEAYDQEAEL